MISILENLNAPLVVVGDCMMRQVFLRLVMLIRGQQRLLDYKVLTNAQYLVCPEADAFRIASVSPNGSARGDNANNGYLKVRIIRKKAKIWITGFFELKKCFGKHSIKGILRIHLI